MGAPHLPLTQRFWNKVIKSEGCWIWIGAIGKINGYGVIRTEGRTKYAHRISWVLANGNIPDDINVLHRCDIRACVNPAHLFLGTQLDNIADCVAKGRNVRGEKVKFAKLTADTVTQIRKEVASGHKQKDVAQRYGIRQANVSVIINGKTWKHA